MPRPVLPKNEENALRQREAIDDAIDRRVEAWQQAERIERYLPTLRARRDELDDLISDEEAVLAEIRASIK